MIYLRLAYTARPPRCQCPEPPRCLSRSAAPRRAPPPCSTPSIGETWDAHDAEHAFNFERHWAALVARAPRGLRAQLLQMERQGRDTSYVRTAQQLDRTASVRGFALAVECTDPLLASS